MARVLRRKLPPDWYAKCIRARAEPLRAWRACGSTRAIMNRPPTHLSQPSPLRILVVDEDAEARTQLMLCLEADGHHAVGHGNVYDPLAEASWQAFDVAFVDLRPGNAGNGRDVIARLHEESPQTRVIVIGENGSAERA